MNNLTKFENVKYEDFLDEKNPERRFKLVYPNREFFFLTEEERNYLLSLVNNGQRFVQIGEHTFSNSFTILYPIKPKLVKKEYVQVDKNTLKEI